MKIEANNLEANAHLAVPASGHGPGVLVLHPWWGLNEDIKNVADRLAEAGFVALAPDLYNGRIATTIEQAGEYADALDEDAARAIVQAAAAAFGDHIAPDKAIAARVDAQVTVALHDQVVRLVG